MARWLSTTRHRDEQQPFAARNEDAELRELAALIESGDTSVEALERIAKLLGQTDPNEDKF